MRKNILHGFTLVEIMVALSIFLIIMYLSASMTGSYSTPSLITQANMYINTQLRQTAERIAWELMQSSSTRIFIDNGLGYKSIRFQLPLEYPNGTLNRTASNDLQWGDRQNLNWFVNYYWDNTQNLTRRILNDGLTPQSGRNITIATNITSFDVILNVTQYEFNLTASIDRYMGRQLPTNVTSSIDFAITPQN